MSELANAMQFVHGDMGLHVMQFPSGKWGFVGRVPSVLAYIHDDGFAPTDSEMRDILSASRPELVCRRYGLRKRVFLTKQEALFAAEHAGCEVRFPPASK